MARLEPVDGVSFSKDLQHQLRNLVVVFGDAYLSNSIYSNIKLCATLDYNSVSLASLNCINQIMKPTHV